MEGWVIKFCIVSVLTYDFFLQKYSLNFNQTMKFPSLTCYCALQGFIIFFLAVLEVVAVQWVYGVDNFCADIEFMLGRKTGWYWRICWAFIIPVSLLVIFFYVVIANEPLTHGSYVFGTGAIGELPFFQMNTFFIRFFLLGIDFFYF